MNKNNLMPVVVKKYLTNGQYLTQKNKKTSIYLHHTAGGSALSSWNWWNTTPERIGTPYLIERDGTIYECFDPAMWAPHLGIRGNNNAIDRTSIGIELANWGPLKKVGLKYFAHPQNYSRIEIPESQVQAYNTPYRGFGFYEKYPKAQIEALIKLIYKIRVEHNIPLKPNASFTNFNGLVVSRNLSGLWSHSTVRRDKTDIHPQPDLIEALLMAKTILS
jgi:N-acetyl-anhydromuramyl-L-alanine amidase AmpD